MILMLGISSFVLFVFGCHGFLEMWLANISQYNVDVAVKITAYGSAITIGATLALFFTHKWAKNQTKIALQRKYPTQPWFWRFDWLNGYTVLPICQSIIRRAIGLKKI